MYRIPKQCPFYSILCELLIPIAIKKKKILDVAICMYEKTLTVSTFSLQLERKRKREIVAAKQIIRLHRYNLFLYQLLRTIKVCKL